MKKQLDTFEPVVLKPMKKRHPKRVPVPDDYDIQCKYGDEMIVWSEDEDVYRLEDFPLSKSMSPNKFYKIADTNDYFAECLDIATQTIGSRLQRSWQDGTIDRDFAMRILPLYNSHFKSLVVKKLEITEQARQGGNVIHVHIPEIPITKTEETKSD